jgi:hypothetical protein
LPALPLESTYEATTDNIFARSQRASDTPVMAWRLEILRSAIWSFSFTLSHIN